MTVLGTDIRILRSMRFHIWILFLVNMLHIQVVMFAFNEFWSPLYIDFWWLSDVWKQTSRNHNGGSKMKAVRITFDIISCYLPKKKHSSRYYNPWLHYLEGVWGRRGGGGWLGRFGPPPVVRRRLLIVGIWTSFRLFVSWVFQSAFHSKFQNGSK